MNTKCSKKILSTTAVATILLLFAFSVMCTPVSAATEAQINQAIDDGMVWLSAQQNPADGSWGTSEKVARTGFAVVKFATHATMADPPEDPFDPSYEYSGEVIDGLNYIFLNAKIIDINVEHGVDNPDTNNNGIGVYFDNEWGGHQTYNTGIAMMAIAASADPNRVVNVPGSPVDGRTYKDVLQDIVDYMAWGQADLAPCRGGWDYTHCDDSGSWADNSNTGYAVLGIGYAQAAPPHGLGCTVPDFVKTELNIWIDYIQNDPGSADDGWELDPDGGSGYSAPDSWVNILKTGNLLYEMGFYGDTESTQRVQDAIDYICRHWDDLSWDPGWKGSIGGGWPAIDNDGDGSVDEDPVDGLDNDGDGLVDEDPQQPDYQATYTTMKGLEVFLIHEICAPPIDWFDEMSTAIVNTQNPDGSWPSDNWGDSMLATEWALLTLQRAVPPLISPVVSDIPDQCVLAGESFATINLDDYVQDGDNDDSEIIWTTSGEVELTVDIDANRVATIIYPVEWNGSETITFTATDPGGQSDSDDATFTVDPVPVVDGIPDQTAPFVSFDLDNYLRGIDPAVVTWSASGMTCLVVSIDGNNVVTVTNPGVCTDPETVTFTATANACSGVVSDSDDATFTPNQLPNVTGAYPSMDCLWPPNHKFVDITIEGVTDPDGDDVTITITGITSDEPTASIDGAGGDKHAPDADGVGTDTASLRAERSGNEDGRVYEITFLASDEIGEPVEGTVQVKVPHDQSGDCVSVDSGQDYDATEVN